MLRKCGFRELGRRTKSVYIENNDITRFKRKFVEKQVKRIFPPIDQRNHSNIWEPGHLKNLQEEGDSF